MEHLTDKPAPCHQKYNVISTLTSIDDDDNDAELNVLSNGKLFIIHILPSNFYNSPAITTEYLKYLEVIKSGEEEDNEVYESDFYDWAMMPFQPVFAELAPAPEQIPKVTLQDALFPEFFVFTLKAVDNKLVPQRIETKDSGHMPPGARLDSEFLDRLNKWTTSFHPLEVKVSFERPEDALFRPPGKVLVDNGQVACFFKPIFPGDVIQAEVELEAYEKISKTKLKSDVRICRLHGVVQNKENLVCGLLLTYIDNAKTLSSSMWPGIPALFRQRWASQLKKTLAELHGEGLVWGDAKDENVLIDKENNAWITDFGGGYTEGWVDKDKAGTIEGDLEGLAKILEFVADNSEAIVQI